MDHELTELLARLAQADCAHEGDVLMLRQLVWDDEGALSQTVVDSLFALNDRFDRSTAAWDEFFIEAVEHYLIHQQHPRGFVSEEGAAWLMARIDRNGRVMNDTELALLVALIEDAENAPESLKAYAIAQIERAIVTGEGPTRGDDVRPGCVDAAEAMLLRRLIFAGGGEGATIVGAAEADMLFRIKDATLHGSNDPAWLQLFVQGVGNHLLAHSDYRPLSRDEAARLNAEMDRNTPNVAGFFRRMLPGERFGHGTIVEAFKSVFPGRPDPLRGEGPQEISRALSLEEASWLKTHIAADGEIDIYEKALLTFVIDEVGNLPSMLETLRRRA
jgi:hypothetical protein